MLSQAVIVDRFFMAKSQARSGCSSVKPQAVMVNAAT
jgi:hypothetical protein